VDVHGVLELLAEGLDLGLLLQHLALQTEHLTLTPHQTHQAEDVSLHYHFDKEKQKK
jgi:hypothetical protein